MKFKELVLLFLLTFIITISQTKKPDILDANHYYSQQNKQKDYTITELDKTKPMIVVLKPVENEAYNNKVTLTINSGSSKKQCTFRSFQDVCVLDKIQQVTGKLTIKCENLPCNVGWRIYQNPINQLENTEKVQNLYKLPSGVSRLIVNVYCQSIVKGSFKQLSTIVIPFSQSQFETSSLGQNNKYIVFQDIKDGYLYFNFNPKYKSCAKMRITKSKSIIDTEEVQDFIKSGKPVLYDIKDFPNMKNVHFDMAFHSLNKQKLTTNVSISITGQKNGERQIMKKNTIKFNPTYKSFDLSYGVSKIDTNQWKSIRLQIQSGQKLLLTQILYKTTDKIEVESTEFSYFNLKKGEKLEYLLVEEKKAEQKDMVNFTLSKPSAFKISKTSCSVKSGCQFEIQAIQDIEGYVYIGLGSGASKQILILDFGSDLSFTRKIKQLESIYIKKKLQLNKAIQVTINSPNVIVYMSNTKKCAYPSQSCYEQLGNIHRHFIYYPDSEEKTEVMFVIQAVDSGVFTLTLLPEDTQFVDLKDSQPFVYLFDSKQDSLKFKFKRQSKVDVSFNLISPLNSLDLIVANGKKIPENDEALISAEGYLEFKADLSPKSQFTILVRKRQGYENKFVHFTLIASTKGKKIQLQSGITHYQTLAKKPDGKAEFIFQFDPKQEYILNFYCHNTKEMQINIKLTARALVNQEKDKKGKVQSLVIDKPSDALDLNDISAELCADVDDQDNCQIAISLQNQMDIQIDIAITLMSHHSILQIKDGIWQSFPTSSIAKSTHFYFYPRNKQNDVEIMFKTTQPLLRLRYKIFYSKQTDIDMSQWPFPSENLPESVINTQLKHKPVNHFSLSKQSLRQCWPNCVILISVVQLNTTSESGTYSILASNSIMQIPEKQKIDVTLKQGQSKSYLVDLKYALDKQQNLYFYITHSIGLTSIFANVYSEKNERVPDSEQFDFSLNSEKEIMVAISSIKQIIKKQQMQDDLNIYLYIVIESLSDTKASIQFSFNQVDQINLKFMQIDTFQHVLIDAHSEKIFYAPIDKKFEVKIIREKGFPIYSAKVCKQELEKCLDQIKDSKQQGTQLLSKVAAYTADNCQSCYYVFKIKTDTDPIDITIHLQSQTSQIELVQNRPIYDFTEKQETNNYILYAIRGQQIYINIHVSEGEIEAELSDLNKLKQKKTSQNIINFVIPGEDTTNLWLSQGKLSKQQKKKQLQKQKKQFKTFKNQIQSLTPAISYGIMQAFGISEKFTEIHVSVKSTSASKPSIYTISYSSGERQFELQDGLITDYILEPNKQTSFYYSSSQPNHIYFTMSMQKSSYLKDLEVKIKYCEPKDNIIDDSCWTEQKVDRPEIRQKTPNPTLMYLLPNKNHLALSLTYSGDHSQKVSLGINHQQLMILPFDVEFPFILHQNQSISFLVELSNDGYIEIITRKCDESNPIFSYTFDYDAFQKGEFTYQAELGANPKSRFISKIKQGTLYMQMKTSQYQRSLVSILIRYSEKKTFSAEMLPGNKGDIDYSIIDSSTGQLKIKPPTCPDSSCPKLKYYLMSAPSMRDLYSQLVCPSNFFTNVEFAQGAQVKLIQVVPKQNLDKTLSISFQLIDQISYIGVKASNGKDKEVFYKPIQVATFWGQLSRTSHTHKLFISSIFMCALITIIICVRRTARRGYKPLSEQNQTGN